MRTTKTFFLFLLTCLIVANGESQCTLAIRQVGLITDTIPKVMIYDVQHQKPIRLNDSTIQFDVPPTRSECLFIFLDYKTRWSTRIWIDSTILHKELIVDYKKRTATIKNGNEIDRVLEEDLQLNEMTQKPQKDSLDEGYIKSHPDVYFSLWLLSHGVNREHPSKNKILLDNLSPRLKKFNEYRQMMADLTGRKYPNYGDSFKEFTLTDNNGKVFNSTSIKSKIIILHFWSNGCGPCVKGMDAMVNFYKSLDTSKIAFISVSLDEIKSKWVNSATTNKIIWTNLWTEDNSYCDLCLNYNLTAMPYFVMFNKDKKITFYNDGEDIELLKSRLKELQN
jgi:thiol-disulfide isomerase/thioredoxin